MVDAHARTSRPSAACSRSRAAIGACTYTSRAIDPPDAHEIESSTLYSSDGTLVYTFHAEENRKVIPSSEIPVHVREAVIAIEDERFYRHNGVDARGHPARGAHQRGAGTSAQGGSTITQQYVKQEILKDDSPTFERKLQEASTASSSSVGTPRTGSSSSTSTPSTSGTAPTASRRPPTSTSGSPPPSCSCRRAR
jgi:membrane carboxypeptidase/penicillin-binding protein PbpC